MKITFIAEHNGVKKEHWVEIAGPIIHPKELQLITDVLFATIKEAFSASRPEPREDSDQP